MPLSRFHVPDIRTEVLRQGLVADISGTTIWRWLTEDAIKPWTRRSWIFPRDPDFEIKASRVLDLDHRTWAGKALRDNEYVISADEKTSIQARIRLHPTSAPQPGQRMRVEHGYDRGGALAYLGAWGRPPGQTLRPLRGNHRDRSLRPSRRSGHENPALRHSKTGLLGGRQRLLAPWTSIHSTHETGLAQRPAHPPPRPLLVAQPDRDLLFHPPTQSPHPQTTSPASQTSKPDSTPSPSSTN